MQSDVEKGKENKTSVKLKSVFIVNELQMEGSRG